MPEKPERVVVGVAAEDLDRPALERRRLDHVTTVGADLTVHVGGGARVDAGVAVVVRLTVGDHAAVGGEGQDPVELVEVRLDAVQQVAAGLVDVDRVLPEQLERHVDQAEPVGAVGLDPVVLAPVAVLVEAPLDADVLRGHAGALDLEVAQLVVAEHVLVGRVVTGDGDEVDDLTTRDDQLVLDHAAVVRLGALGLDRGLLAVDAGQDVDRRCLHLDGVDRSLDVLELALVQQFLVERTQVGVLERGDAVCRVVLADHETCCLVTGLAVGRDLGRGVGRWEHRGALLVGDGHGRDQHEQAERRCEQRPQNGT